MLRLTTGFLVPFAALFGVVLWQSPTAAPIGGNTWTLITTDWLPMPIARLAVLLLLIPAAASILTADLFHRLAPRRALDPRVHRPFSLAIRGIIAGLSAAAAGLAALMYVTSPAAEPWLIAAASSLATLVALATLPRVRPGRCVHCDYDLRAGIAGPAATAVAARCPECGAFHSAG